MTIFTIRSGLSLVFFPPRLYSERLELAIQVRALEAAFLRNARYRAVLEREVMLEVGALERLARVAQGQIERQVDPFRGRGELRQHRLDVVRADLFLERRSGQGAHRGREILQIAGPIEIAQLV